MFIFHLLPVYTCSYFIFYQCILVQISSFTSVYLFIFHLLPVYTCSNFIFYQCILVQISSFTEKTRQKKVAALNAIGMWYRFCSYKSKYFPSTNPLHGGESSGLMNPQNEKICSTKRHKLTSLKTNMYNGVTKWRSIRNGRFTWIIIFLFIYFIIFFIILSLMYIRRNPV